MSFRLGEAVEGTVHEALEDGDVIVSFDGDLLRLCNRTGRKFHDRERVELTVTHLRPLRFRLQGGGRASHPLDGHYDVSV